MSHSRVPAKAQRVPHRRTRPDRVTLPPICDGEGVGVDCCGDAQRSGAKRPSGALGARRMPLVDSATTRQRLAEVHAAERRTKGVVTPLMYACQQSRETQVRELLAQKSDLVLLRDRTMKSALHYCVENSNPASAELVLAAAPELLDAPDQEGFTPLHLAVIAGNVGLVRFLLHRRADLTAIDNEKHSVVHWATVCGENEALEALLDAGATPSSPDIHGGYPIHYASQMCGANSEMGNDTKVGLKILKTLLARGVDVNVVDEDGRQPILWAASAGSADAVLSLVNAGSAVQAEDKDGLTALHCAASRGHTECLETLITLCGAEVNVIDANGCTALFYAVTLGHADCTQLLLNFGSDPNMQDRRGRTAAHCGAAKGQLETLKLLSASGADLWKRNVRGDLPLHDAIQSGRRELVRWLLGLRPDMSTVANSDGRSGLHIAATTNNVEMCRVLLNAQSFVNPVMRNPKGVMMTPLDSALVKENRGCAKYLQLHGGVPASKLTEEAAAIRGPQRAMTESQMDNLTPRPDSYNHLGLTPRGALNFDNSGATTPAILPDNLQIPPVDQTTQTPSEMTSDVKMVERGVSARGSQKSHKKGRSRKSPSTARSTPSSSDSEETADAKSEDRGKHRSSRKHRGKRKSSEKRETSKTKPGDQKKSEDEQSDNLISDDDDTTATVKTEIELVSANKLNSARNDLKKEDNADHISKELSKSKSDKAPKQPISSETESKSLAEKVASEIIKNATLIETVATPEKPNNKSEQMSAASEEPKISEKQNGKHPKSRDPSPTKRESSPPKQESIPTKRDASPPKRDPSPSKKDSSPPKSGKTRPKSGKKIEKQTSGSKTSEADTDNPPSAQAGEQDIDQTGTDSNEKNNKEVSRQNSETTHHLSVSSGPIIIIEESASVMMDEDEEENADAAVNIVEENKPIAEASKEPAPATDTDKKQTGDDKKSIEGSSEDPSKKVDITEVACEKILAEDSKNLEKETAALVKNAIKDAQEANSSPDLAITKEATETESKVDETKKPAPAKTLETKSDVTEVETHKDSNNINGKTDDKIIATPSSPKKEVEFLDSNKTLVKDEEKMCSAKSTTNGMSYVIQNDDATKGTSNGIKTKKMPPLKRKEKSIEKSDSVEKNENGSKRVSREVSKDDVKRHNSKELKSKAEERNGSKSRENKSLSKNRKKSNERSAEMMEKTKSVSEEDKNSSKKSSAQASVEEANHEESSEASDRSRAADSGVMMAEHSLSDSPKSKHKSNKGIVKVIPDSEENKELINGKPSQRVTPTILSRMNARNNRAQIEEDEKKAREIIRKRHEQSVVSVTQAVQVSTRKYQLERKIFQELLELKKLQIRAGKTNETILVKRAVDEYRKAGLIVGLRQYDGPYSFRSFEQYLYDQLQVLQNSSDARIIARLKPSDDVESLTTALKRSIPGTIHHSPAFCTLSTHRCNHATDAYTTVPVPNYVGRLPRTESFLPRIEAPLGTTKSGKGNKLIMSPSRTLQYVDPRRPVTLELSHGGERQVIALPTERLDRTKRYYVTFTIKPGDGQPAIMPVNIEDKTENKHKHATSL